MIKLFTTLVSNNDPYTPRNYVYLDTENIVVMSAIYMLVKTHNFTDITEPFCLVNPKVKDAKLTDLTLWEGYPITREIQYMEYKRLTKVVDIANEYTNYITKPDTTFINALYTICSNAGTTLDFIRLATQLKKIDKEIGYITLGFFAKDRIVLQSDKGYTFIVMHYAT